MKPTAILLASRYCYLILFALLLAGCAQDSALYQLEETEERILLETESYHLSIEKQGFRYAFKKPDE
jgi:uncharacterized protein YcfL